MVTVSASLLRYRDGGRSKCREEARCRMCLRPASVRKLTRHHLVDQAWFKKRMALADGAEWMRLWRLRDCDVNCIPLCEPCHRAVEEDALARRMLRKALGGAEAAFAIQLRGARWFNARYPAAREGRSPRVRATLAR